LLMRALPVGMPAADSCGRSRLIPVAAQEPAAETALGARRE